MSSVTTPSQAILEDYKKKENASKEDKEEELYALYLKLKDKFE